MTRGACILAMLLAPAVTRAQSIEVTLPPWCTELGPEREVSSIPVVVRTELDEVEVNGVTLRRVASSGLVEGHEFAGSIDILPLVRDKELYQPIGDLELRVLAVGRGGMARSVAICRLHRMVQQVAELRLLAAVGKPNDWAAPYRGEVGETTYVLIDKPDQPWKRAEVSFPSSSSWKLRLIELIVVEEWRRRVLGRCPRCRYEGLDQLMRCPRVQQQATIRVHVARTGALLATKTFSGPVPRTCGDGVPYSELVGGPVDAIDKLQWVRGRF